MSERRPTPALLSGFAVGAVALGLGLAIGRADVAVLGVPLLAGVALALLASPHRAGTGPAVEAAPPGTVDQGARVRLALRLVAPGAELVAVRLPAAGRVPLGETVLLRGGERELGVLVHVAGRGRVVLARPDWLAFAADGLTAVGPVAGPEAVALSLPAADRIPPGPAAAASRRVRRCAPHPAPGRGVRAGRCAGLPAGRPVAPGGLAGQRAALPGLQELYVRRTHADADADVLLYVDTRVDVGTDAALWAVPPGRDAAGTPCPVRASTSPSAPRRRWPPLS